MIFIYTIRQGFGYRKIGITNKPKQRLESIQDAYPKAKWAVLLPTPFIAGIIERMFHKLLNFARVTRKGSGKTEWFQLLWPFTWVVDILITAIVALSWYGVWQLFVYAAEWYSS